MMMQVARSKAADVDERAVRGQVLHPQRRRLDGGDAGRCLHHGSRRYDRLLAIDAVLVHRERGYDADEVSRPEALDGRADRVDPPAAS